MSEGLMLLQLDPLDHHFDPEGQAPTLWASTSWSTDGDESSLLRLVTYQLGFFHSQTVEQRAMGTLPVIVGLDYSDRSGQVCVLNEQGQVLGNRGCANDWQAIKEFAESRGRVVRAAIESCSGAADLWEGMVEPG